MIETCRLKEKIKKLMDKRSVNVVVFYSDCKRTTLHVHRFVMSNLENNSKLKRSFVLEDDFNFLKFTITKKPEMENKLNSLTKKLEKLLPRKSWRKTSLLFYGGPVYSSLPSMYTTDLFNEISCYFRNLGFQVTTTDWMVLNDKIKFALTYISVNFLLETISRPVGVVRISPATSGVAFLAQDLNGDTQELRKIYLNKMAAGSSDSFPEQTDVNYSDCAKEVKETVSTLRKTPSMSGQTIYAISGYYSALTSHKLIDDQDGGNFTLKQIKKKARESCGYYTSDDEFRCMDVVIMYSLLKHTYGLQENDIIHVRSTIKGFNINWSLGAAYLSLLQNKPQT
ncbi:hypothetical protein RUM44_008223 [Polyplax serrata]|uniref:Uncharacterized protein n=1 Tax=Polyplax serrata TaxID=468196 RepID=A0ABR1B7W0_POLSC